MTRLTPPPEGATPEQAERHYLAWLEQARSTLASQRQERDPEKLRRDLDAVARRTDDAELVELIRAVQRGTRSRFDLYRNPAYQAEVQKIWAEESDRLRADGVDLKSLMRERLADAGLSELAAPDDVDQVDRRPGSQR